VRARDQRTWPVLADSQPYPTPLVLSEYPDPNEQGIYFIVPVLLLSALTDDELVVV
jgi:hypothetical protein